MSALGHLIESKGVATVVVGLVRAHMERTRPPRGLWVPFPLGRPFGEPEDPAFQRRVLRAALELLQRKDGPVILVDYPDDAPSMKDTAGWVPQVPLPPLPSALPTSSAVWAQAVSHEIGLLQSSWEAARQRFGRTTVGNSGLQPSDWGPFAARFLDGGIPPSPIDGLSSAVVLRYIADDIKALYAEAAQAAGPQPSSNQVTRWFWNRTVAGAFLRALRIAAMASEHAGFKTAGSRFIVPGPWVEPDRAAGG